MLVNVRVKTPASEISHSKQRKSFIVELVPIYQVFDENTTPENYQNTTASNTNL